MDLTKQDADKRSSLPYPMELGSPAFAPVPVDKEKDVIHNAGKLHAKQEYDRIMEQVEVLKRQAEALSSRMAVSEMMHSCVYGFKPVHGKVYYVYNDTDKNQYWLSLNHPNSWSALGANHTYIMTVQLMGDSTWQEVLDET